MAGGDGKDIRKGEWRGREVVREGKGIGDVVREKKWEDERLIAKS